MEGKSGYTDSQDSDVLVTLPVSDNAEHGITSLVEEEDEKFLIPDGGWGWVVCVAAFVVSFIADGTLFFFGILLLELLDDFHESKALTSWVGSAQLGMSMLMGPLVSLLLKRYSTRQVTMAGALVCALGLISSAFAPNVSVLIVMYGLVAGTGLCMTFLSSVISVGLYFDKKRAIATGIATSGSGVGVFVYANVCDMLLQYFTWRETVLLLGAFTLHCLACGLVFRPFAPTRLSQRKTRGREGGREQRGDSDDVYDMEEKGGKSADLGTTKMNESDNVEEDDICGAANRYSNGVTNNSTVHDGLEIDGTGGNPASGKKSPVTALAPLRPLLRKKTNLCGERNRQADNQRRGVHMASLVACDGRCGQGIQSVLATHLFTNRAFLFLLVTFCTWTVQSVPLTYLPDLTLSKGVPRHQAAFLISIVGITNTASRIVAGVLVDLLHLRCIWLYVVALSIASVVCYAFPWCEGFGGLAVNAAVFGMCMAVAVSMRTIVLTQELGLSLLTQSFGLVALFQGVFFTLDPPMAGKLYDETGSYLLPFVMAGSMYLVSALSSLVVAVFFKPAPVYVQTLVVDPGTGQGEVDS